MKFDNFGNLIIGNSFEDKEQYPFSSVINNTLPFLAKTSSTFEIVFSNKSLCGAKQITGIFSSTNAIGPCFNSPLGYPSA